jgi:hypothetical protein
MTDTTPHRPSRASPGADDDFSRVYRDQVDRLRRVAYLMTGQAAIAEETPQVVAPSDDDPNRETLGTFSGGMADDGLAVELMIEQRSASTFEGYPGAEAIQAGENHGWFLTMEGSDGRLTGILLDFGDLMVNITGMHIERDVMLGVAASVRRTADGFEYTAPPNLAPLCT